MFGKRIYLFFLVIFLLHFWGCGGSGNENSKTMTPEELGKAIGGIYLDTMTEVAGMMATKEDIGTMKPKLETLKVAVIEKLVKLGKMREALSGADRATVDRHISMGFSSIPRKTYDRYNDGYKYYAKTDVETGNLIASFNIITQYASFDLLKKQNPKEAARLGIE